MSFWDRFKKAKQPPVSQGGSPAELGARLQSMSSHGQVNAQTLDDLSRELGVPREEAYVVLSTSMTLQLQREHAVQFLVCTGNCRDRGALAGMQRLLEIRDARLAKGQAAFDIVPRQCLARCQVAPAVEVSTADGTAVLARATPQALAEAVDDLF